MIPPEADRNDISVVLVDDNEIIRLGVRAILKETQTIRLIGVAGNAGEGTDILAKLRPDLVVTEFTLRDGYGAGLINQLQEASPETRVLLYSAENDEDKVLEAFRARARAYVLKQGEPDELTSAIRRVTAGHMYLSPPLMERAIDAFISRRQNAEVDAYQTLSLREREVMQLASQGCSNSEIAKRLFISRRTVEIHRANLHRKLGLKALRNQFSEYVRKMGILPGTNGAEPQSTEMENQ